MRMAELQRRENLYTQMKSIPGLLQSSYLLLRGSLLDATVPNCWRKEAEKVFERLAIGNDSPNEEYKLTKHRIGDDD